MEGGSDLPFHGQADRRATRTLADRRALSITWAAVLGGAVTVASLNLIMLALGTGLGISAVSPWNGLRGEAEAIGGATIGWYIAMQVISASVGGYLAGRFRKNWLGRQSDAVPFRDTAHGFLAWGVAFLGTVAFLAAASTFLAGGVAAGADAPETAQPGASGYFVDMLLRPMNPTMDAVAPPVRAEVGVIFAKGLAIGALPETDRAYLARVMAPRAGIDVASAEQRVTTVFSDALAAATAAKDAVGHGLLWVFLALLIGAFTASVAAMFGGRTRERLAHV